jgi:transcriptional regulator with XRE-family HTH domain
MIDLKKVSMCLKTRRTELGMSLQDVSERTGLSPSTIMRYESQSIHKLPLENLALLADALDISVSWLLGLESENESGKQESLTDKEKSLIAQYRLLNDAGREKVFAYISDIKGKYGKG